MLAPGGVPGGEADSQTPAWTGHGRPWAPCRAGTSHPAWVSGVVTGLGQVGSRRVSAEAGGPGISLAHPGASGRAGGGWLGGGGSWGVASAGPVCLSMRSPPRYY